MSQYPQQFPQQTVVVQVPQSGGGGFGIASFVVGIVAILFFCLPIVGIPLAGVGLLLGIAGLIVAIVREGRGLAWSIAGLVVNVFALLPILALLGIVGGGIFGGAFDAARKAARDAQAQHEAKNRQPPAAIAPADPGASRPELQPDAAKPDAPATKPPDDRLVMRTWRTSDGKFEVQAQFVKFDQGKVVLKKANGNTINVDRSRFSEEDRAVLDGIAGDNIKEAPQKIASGKPPASDADGDWADARNKVRHGNVEIQITRVAVEHVQVKSFREGQSKNAQLVIRVRIGNLDEGKKINYRGWQNGSSLFSEMRLADDLGNQYKEVDFGLGAHPVGQVTSESLYPGKAIEDVFVFEVPVEKATFLRLELPAKNVGGEGKIRFEIPKDLIQK